MDEKDLKIQDLKAENEQLKKSIAEYQRKCESFSLKLHGLLNDKAVLEQELECTEGERKMLESLYEETSSKLDEALGEVAYLEDEENSAMDYEIEMLGRDYYGL